MTRKSSVDATAGEVIDTTVGVGTIAWHILQNAAATDSLPHRELAVAIGTTSKTINEEASRLRRRGLLAPSTRQFTRAAAPLVKSDSAVTDPQSLLDDLESETILTELDRRRILSRIARRAPSPVRVQAVARLEELDRQRGEQVGPPVPMTNDELTDRLEVLIYAAGSHVGGVAIQRALERWKNDERHSLDDEVKQP